MYSKIYRTLLLCPVFITLVMIMGGTPLYAQKQLRFYPTNLPQYPGFTDLCSGLISNPYDSVININLTIELKDQAGQVVSDSVLVPVPKGISQFTSDTLTALFKYNNIAQDISYLLPGEYTFQMQLRSVGGTLSHKLQFRVPPFQVKIVQQGPDTLHLVVTPSASNLQAYLCRGVESRFKKHPVKINCFSAGEVLTRSAFVPDTLNDYRYKIEVYAGEHFIAKTDFTRWEEIAEKPGWDTADIKPQSNLNKYVQLNASVAVEYGYTNSRYVNQLAATHYTRFYFRPTLTVMGIPLTFNTMLTTENNSHYPLNFFQLGFDANKFSSDFSNNMIKEQLDIEQRLDLNKMELEEVDLSLEKYKRMNMKHGIEQPEYNYEDSLKNPLKYNLKQKRKKKIQHDLDIDMEQLQRKKEMLQYQRDKDSLYLLHRYSADLPGDTLHRYLNRQKGKTFVRTLLAIRSLNIGLCNPHYSDVTLSQVPLQGVHTDLRFPRWFVSATAGKRITFEQPMGLRDLMRPDFENKTYAGKIGYIQRRSNTSVGLAYFRFRNVPGTLNTNPSENDIVSVFFESGFVEWLNIKAEAAKSFYVFNTSDKLQADKYTLADSWNKDFDNLAFHSSATISAAKNTQFLLTGKRIGSGYYTLGIPFLRNDYFEYSAEWKQFYWLRQLETGLSFMQNRDNLTGNKTHTTILTGYGASLKTHFRAYPNLLVFYKPFNSSFSFEDNLFNQSVTPGNIVTQQFYIFHATLFYNKVFRGSASGKRPSVLSGDKKGVFALSYNRSNNQNSQGSIYTLETVTGNVSLTDKSTRQLTYALALYFSSISSNNAKQHDLNYSLPLLKNKMRITAGALAHFVDDGRKRAGLYGQATCNLGAFNLSARCGSNYLEGNWFITNNTFENTFNIMLEWKL